MMMWAERLGKRACDALGTEEILHCTIAHTFDLDFLSHVQLLAMQPFHSISKHVLACNIR